MLCAEYATFNIAVTAFDGGQDQDLTDWLTEGWDLPGTYNSPMLQSRLSRRRRRHRLWLQLIMAYPLKWSCRAQKECQRCMLHNAKWSLFVQDLSSSVPPSSSPTPPHSPPVHVSSYTTAAICWALGTCLIEWRLRSLLLLSHPRPSSPEPSRVLLLIDNFDWHTTTIHYHRSWRRRCDAMMMKGTWLFTDRSIDRHFQFIAAAAFLVADQCYHRRRWWPTIYNVTINTRAKTRRRSWSKLHHHPRHVISLL